PLHQLRRHVGGVFDDRDGGGLKRIQEHPLRAVTEVRMKKKKRLKKKQGRGKLVWIIAGLVVLLLGGAFLFCWTARITDITVTGTSRYTEDEIISMIFKEDKDRNPFYAVYQE